MLRRPERRSAEDRALLAGLCEHSCVLDKAIGLAEEFAALVRGREPERLDPWLRRAQDATLSARPYSDKIDEVLADVAAVLGAEDHPLLADRRA